MLAIGEAEKRFMKKKIKYTNEPMGKLKIIPDFLPKPSELVLKEDNVKVTLMLSRESVEFFKKEADQLHTQYQKMIRILLDAYAQNCNQVHKKSRSA